MLVQTTQKLYQNYDLKRVFYSAYIPVNEDSALPALETPVPLLREHRLYQADWLLRFYGFQADELLSEERPNFNVRMDPKCDWALRHMARRYGHLEFDHLKKMGVVLKRAHYFITCGGRMMYKIPIEEQYITRQLIGEHAKENWQVEHKEEEYKQLSFFDAQGVFGVPN